MTMPADYAELLFEIRRRYGKSPWIDPVVRDPMIHQNQRLRRGRPNTASGRMNSRPKLYFAAQAHCVLTARAEAMTENPGSEASSSPISTSSNTTP